jgi:hypothetical protein
MGTTHIQEVLPMPELTKSEPNREREGCVAYLYSRGVLMNFNTYYPPNHECYSHLSS